MSHSMEYAKMKTANEARLAEEARTDQLQKSVLVLILDYLQSEGYHETAGALEGEGGVSLSRSRVCDNIDLASIVREFESYYSIKFGRPPKLIKRVRAEGEGSADTASSASSSSRQAPRRTLSGKRRPLPNIQSPAERRRSSADRKPRSSVSGPPAGPATPHAHAGPRPPRPTKAGSRAATHTHSHTAAAAPGPPSDLAGQAQDGDVDINLAGVSIASARRAGPGKRQASSTSQGLPASGSRAVDVRREIQAATRLPTDDFHGDKLLKPLSSMGYSGQMRDLAEVISRDIYTTNPNVRWADIIGLEGACRLAKEAVVYPIKYPSLFQGLLSPWKGLLLYGPPGTGKTMLAKAVATESKTTFFNISSSSIVSKWRGDSEKLVRVLFELARHHAPSTIFLDELDSIMSTRGGTGGASDHEGSRRMKTELLVQMDGLAKSDDLVFLLAASNLPWELDPAMLRRLEKRILVDLPTAEARTAMFRHHLPPVLSESTDGGVDLRCSIDYSVLAEGTDGYSGSDIKLVCKEAAMRVVRKVFDVLEGMESPGTFGDGAGPVPLEPIRIKLDPLVTADVLAALQSTKPSAKAMQDRYRDWQAEFESS